ncbi:MAG: dihydroorotase [Cyanobacteriota bacterium]|nr:dihydroorotase [Cyanobacteriota bacterium]
MLQGPGLPLEIADVWISGGQLTRLEPAGTAPFGPGAAAGHEVIDAESLLLAPCLVDPHSLLEQPLQGRAETLESLLASAVVGGYGTVAVLPNALPWRDRPELLLAGAEPQRLLSWGAFSKGGADRELAPHGDLLAAGAIGLAGGPHLPPVALVEKALQLGEASSHPLLLAPRDPTLSGGGILRQRVEALRLGWPTDPALSETLPLQCVLALAQLHPQQPLRLMNLSTAEAVELLRQAGPGAPLATVAWWHLVADSGRLDPLANGWRLEPPLGGPGDRQALVTALAEGLITAVAVHHIALDGEEQLLPLDQRRPGLAGHGLVLSVLWQELVAGAGWCPSQLWQGLCWGPCRLLGLPAERLGVGGRRWLLFDPQRHWQPDPPTLPSRAANQPCRQQMLTGQVVATGLSDPGVWLV